MGGQISPQTLTFIAGKVSSPLDVPQGSIIEPLLFVLYINDVCDACASCLKWYADDARMYQKIMSRKYVLFRHSDLYVLLSWSQIWINFNLSNANLCWYVAN